MSAEIAAVLAAVNGETDADLAPFREVAAKLTAELNGRGEVTLKAVREIASGLDRTDSHPITPRIVRELRERNLLPE